MIAPKDLEKIAAASRRLAQLADAIAHLHSQGLLDDERIAQGLHLLHQRQCEVAGHLSAARVITPEQSGGAR